MAGYKLDLEAVNDLRQIARYTQITWGAKQAAIYEQKLIACIRSITQGTARARSIGEINKDLYFIHCQHHYIFYLATPKDSSVVIVAVLHEKMDLISRIKARLG